jgi:hypothetical protein
MAAASAPTNQAHSCWERLPSWVPLVTPAVKSDACEIDRELLEVRIQKVFSFAFPIGAMSIVTVLLIGTIYPVAGMALSLIAATAMLTPLIVEPLDRWIAEKAANVKAVGEYLSMPFPSPLATRRIQHNLSAVQLLVRTSKKGEVVNKIDSDGYRLLGEVVDRHRLLENQRNLNIFKLLIDHDADVTMLDRAGITYFEMIIEKRELDYLKYILESRKVTPEHFTADQQVRFWTKVNRFAIGQLLVKHGFNVNVTDSTDDTPLLKLAKQGLNSQTVSTLLNCGADPTITVLHKGVQKNALEVTTNEKIRHILQNIPSTVKINS